MAWIEFHAATVKRKLKFHEFRKSLGWSVLEALGFLGSFWGEAIEVCEGGEITTWSPEYLAELTGLKPDFAQRVWDALQAHGWVDCLGDGRLLIHDWLEYAGNFLRGKYSGKRERLVEIWAIHGQIYGKKEEPTSYLSVTDKLPTSPNQPNLTKPNQEKHCPAKAPDTVDLNFPVEYLNSKIGTRYKPDNKSTRKMIKARYTEGRTRDDFKRVIDKKIHQWHCDDKMRLYLRPETLFNQTKFESYLNEPDGKSLDPSDPRNFMKEVKNGR